LALLAAVLAEAPALPVDRHIAARYGELRASAARRPSNDLWIAATALAHDLTLITADESQATLPLVRSRLVGTWTRISMRPPARGTNTPSLRTRCSLQSNPTTRGC
jgi:hypothetical protein